MLQETDSDDGPTNENNYKLTNQDKDEIFSQIRDELEIIDEPRQERQFNCGKIFSEDYQQQRKNEFYSSYQDYIYMLSAINEQDETNEDGIEEDSDEGRESHTYEYDQEINKQEGEGEGDSPSPARRSRDDRNKKVFYSDVNDYLYQVENEDKVLVAETPDKTMSQPDEESKYMNDTHSSQTTSQKHKNMHYENTPEEVKSKARAYYQTDQIINTKTLNDSNTQQTNGMSTPAVNSSMSFANKNDRARFINQKHDSLQSSEAKSHVRTEDLQQNESLSVDQVRNNEEQQPYSETQSSARRPQKIGYSPYTAKGFVNKQPQFSSEESKEEEEQHDLQSEVADYMRILVEKYENSSYKPEAEKLILELNKIRKLQIDSVPQNFINKFEAFLEWCDKVKKTPKIRKPKKEVVQKSSRKSKTRREGSGIKKQEIHEETKEVDRIEPTRVSNSDFIKVIQENQHLLKEYEVLVREYEETRVEIKAKTLMRFKSLQSPTKIDINIAVILLYYFYQVDNSILLRSDKRQLEDKSWNYARNYLSNCGKVIRNMKYILPFLEDKRIPESHYIEIKRHIETLSPAHIEALHQKNGVTGLIYNYAMACFNITKFLRSVYNADSEPKVRKIPYNPPKPKPETRIISQEDMNTIVASKTKNFKVELHSNIYNENVALAFENRKKEADIKSTETRIKELKRLKNNLQLKEKRDLKQKAELERKMDEEEYRRYQDELRTMTIGLLQQKLAEDKAYKLQRNSNQLQEQRLIRLKEALLDKMNQLDGFKQTLELSEWKQLQEKEKAEEKLRVRQEFYEKLQEEKVFKQLLYAAEKQLEQEDRKRKREEALKGKHDKLLREQQELEEELAMLQQMYSS